MFTTSNTENCYPETKRYHYNSAVSWLSQEQISLNLISFRNWFLVLLLTWCGSVAEWLACWTQAQKGPGSNRNHDAAG